MKKNISQIKLPAPSDTDPHPRLLLDGYGIHAGESFRALFPNGWHDITLEVGWNETGPTAGTSPPLAIRMCAQWGYLWKYKQAD